MAEVRHSRSADPNGTPESRKKTILLVDDERMVRVLVQATIESDDYILLEARDGEEAIAMARTHRPHLVLLDVEMPPGLSGWDVCRRIKSTPETADAIVVMLTAHHYDSDREKGLAAGADFYMTKPFSPLTLMRKLRELLGR